MSSLMIGPPHGGHSLTWIGDNHFCSFADVEFWRACASGTVTVLIVGLAMPGKKTNRGSSLALCIAVYCSLNPVKLLLAYVSGSDYAISSPSDSWGACCAAPSPQAYKVVQQTMQLLLMQGTISVILLCSYPCGSRYDS